MPVVALMQSLPPASVTPSQTSSADLNARQQKWDALTGQFDTKQLQRHSWEWVSEEFLPVYTFQPVTHITEIWDEHAAGLNGFLAVHDFDKHWQAHWRQNINTLRTENCR